MPQQIVVSARSESWRPANGRRRQALRRPAGRARIGGRSRYSARTCCRSEFEQRGGVSRAVKLMWDGDFFDPLFVWSARA